MNKTLVFNEDECTQIVKKLVTEASKNSGSSYNIYVEKLTNLVDVKLLNLEPKTQKLIINMAVKHGYNDIDDSYVEGECSHGVDIQSCSAGCADIEW